LQITLDGITAEYLTTSGISERMLFSSYKPGGEFYTDAEAMKWFIGEALHLSVKKVSRFAGAGSLTIDTDDTVSREALVALLDVEIVFQGKVWTFSDMEPCAEHYEEYYGSPSTERWIEITFKVKE
jgi:hypothetical protein